MIVTRGARVGIVAALVVLAAVLVSSGDPAHATSAGGTWRRIDVHEAFGSRADVFAIARGGPGFVAVGRRGAGRRNVWHPAVWTSTDGEHWSRVHGLRFRGGPFPGFGRLASSRGVLVTSTDGTELWRSTDAKTWRLVERLGRSSRAGSSVTVGPQGFVAVGSGPFDVWSSPVATSVDGRDWKGAEQIGTVNHPVGLFPDAPLGSRWLSAGPSVNGAPPMLYASKDGAHWARIAEATVPKNLAPVAGNRRGSRVLGVQYPEGGVPGSFGRRLWSSRDATTWTEVTSFHRQLPVANPDSIVQSGAWWVFGGTTGTPDGKRRAAMWSSPDLRHWYAMSDTLWGPKMFGGGVTLTEGKGRVVGLGSTEQGSELWLWTPPE